MKEFEPRVPLTRQGNTSTLRSEGNFMADQSPQESDSQESTYEKVLALRWARQSQVPWEKVSPEVREIFKEQEKPPEKPRQETHGHLPSPKEIEDSLKAVRERRMTKGQLEDLFERIRSADITSGLSEEEYKKMSPSERQAVRDRAREKDEERAIMLVGLGNEIRKEMEAQHLIRPEPEKEGLMGELRAAVIAENYDEIEHIIGQELHSDEPSTTYAEVIRSVVEELQGLETYNHVLEDVLEYGLERILGRADDDPKSPYPRFNLYEEMNLDAIIQAARIYDEKSAQKRGEDPNNRVFRRLINLRSKRHAMHELFRGMKNRKTYVDLVTELLRKEGFAFVEKEIAGVSDTQIMYEQVLGSRLAFTKEGWLNGDDFAKADQEVKAVLEYSIGKNPGNYQKTYILKEGREGEETVYGTRRLRGWELKRALAVGRSLGAASLRRPVYGVLGDLPKRDPRSIKSLEFEFMDRILAPFKLVPWRFFYQPIARRFLDRMVHELKRKADGKIDHFKYGYLKDGKEKGLYGKSQYALAIVDTGVTDPKSNGWRNRNLFLEQEDFRTKEIDGNFYSIGEYFDRLKLTIEDELKEEAKRAGDLQGDDWEIENQWEVFLKTSDRHPYKPKLKKRFNDKVRGDIRGERLFLGTLMRHYDLDDANKAAIWENVANLLPSRMVAFFPEETLKIIGDIYGIDAVKAEALWDAFKMKLWLIERARVKEDAETLKKRERPQKGLDAYYEGEGRVVDFTQEEIRLIKALQQMGKNHVVTDAQGNPIVDENGNPSIKSEEEAKGGLVRMKFPFTAFLDDVPKTDWEKLEDEDYDRILVNDHSNYQDGHKELISVIAFPGMSPKAIVEHFNKAFDNIEQPLGRSETQKYMEVYLDTYLPMARQSKKASWIGIVMKNLYKPRSEMEKYNMAARIAQDEKDQEEIINGCAAHETISADKTKVDKNGKTQHIRVLERNKADRKYQFLRWVRLIMQILGPIAGKDFVKMILPGNLSKDLGI